MDMVWTPTLLGIAVLMYGAYRVFALPSSTQLAREHAASLQEPPAAPYAQIGGAHPPVQTWTGWKRMEPREALAQLMSTGVPGNVQGVRVERDMDGRPRTVTRMQGVEVVDFPLARTF